MAVRPRGGETPDSGVGQGGERLFRYVSSHRDHGPVERHRAPNEVTLVDMPNGVEHLGIGTAKDVDVMLVVVESTYNSLETAPKTNEHATELGIPDVQVVANKIRTEQDREVVEAYCSDHELELVAGVSDDVIRHAERDSTAPIDAATNSAAVRAICDLADEIADTNGQRHRRADP